MLDWDKYPNFSREEFECSETGNCYMREDFMDLLQKLRTQLDEPMTITSGFRDPTHPVEASKEAPGVHTRGLAADVACDTQQAHRILKLAFALGFTGIGVKQSGHGRFVHLDTFTGKARPNVWSYK